MKWIIPICLLVFVALSLGFLYQDPSRWHCAFAAGYCLSVLVENLLRLFIR